MACNVPPIYLSDASANQCIFVAPGQLRTMFVHIKVQCTNATLDNVIEVNYISSVNQVGQNIFCFAGVNSIGNQGDSTCLRLTVQMPSENRSTLHINNAIHYPMGLVSKSQSTSTLIDIDSTRFCNL